MSAAAPPSPSPSPPPSQAGSIRLDILLINGQRRVIEFVPRPRLPSKSESQSGSYRESESIIEEDDKAPGGLGLGGGESESANTKVYVEHLTAGGLVAALWEAWPGGECSRPVAWRGVAWAGLYARRASSYRC